MSKIISWLQRTPKLSVWFLTQFISVCFSLSITSFMSWILLGFIDGNFLITGFVVSFIVTILVQWISVTFLNQFILLEKANANLRSLLEKDESNQNALRIAEVAFQSHNPTMVTNNLGHIERVNQSFEELFGYSIELIQHNRGDFILDSQGYWNQFLSSVKSEVLKKPWKGELRVRSREGQQIPVFCVVSPVHQQQDSQTDITHFVVSFTDLRQHQQSLEHINYLTNFDMLTGLPNREQFKVRLEMANSLASRNKKNGILIVLDVMGFHLFNDTFGSDNGDKLLVELSRSLKKTIRENDSLARVGADEFALILQDLEVEDTGSASSKIQGIVTKILSAIVKPRIYNNESYTPKIRGGLVVFDGSLDETYDLMIQAEQALLQAKLQGKDGIHYFEPSLQLEINRRIELEQELEIAITKQQFRLFLQPQVENGKITGAEALIRWQHPTRGVLNPGEFMSIVESSDLLFPLGYWILEEACKILNQFQNSDITQDLQIGVNISPRQLAQDDFVEKLLSIIQCYSLDPGKLKLELTETSITENYFASKIKMEQIRRYGIQLSIDDFGLGYSSLSTLKHLPFDQLKIDRSFISDLSKTDNDSAVIVQMIIGLATTLKLDVIAEGVETEEQVAILKELGCYHYQGYYFGKPGAVDSFVSSLQVPFKKAQ